MRVAGRRVQLQRPLELANRLVDLPLAEPIGAREDAVRLRAIGLQAQALLQRGDGLVRASHREQRVAALNVRVAVGRAQLDGGVGELEAALEERGLREKRSLQVERAGERDERLDVLRIELHRLLEERNRAIDRVLAGKPEVQHAARVRLIRLHRLGAGVLDGRSIALPDFDLQSVGELGHQAILQLEQLIDAAVDLHRRRSAGRRSLRPPAR